MAQTLLPETAPTAPQARALPPYAVVLHNDDHNEMAFVVQTVVMLVRVPTEQAVACMLEAHEEGQAVVLRTHREHAELVCEQLQSRGLTASVERIR
jgi:ATP-dependent Clp protease adaptor protein ClpS